MTCILTLIGVGPPAALPPSPLPRQQAACRFSTMEGCSTSELVAYGGSDSQLSMCSAHKASCPQRQWLSAAYAVCSVSPCCTKHHARSLQAAAPHLLKARSMTVVSPAALPRSPCSLLAVWLAICSPAVSQSSTTTPPPQTHASPAHLLNARSTTVISPAALPAPEAAL
jgi:hypothetical protein